MQKITTASSVDALKPRAERYIVRDRDVSGLELRINPDGVKTWSVRYRVHGQQRRLKLGQYPRVTLAKARTAANVELRKIDGGIDPQAERQAQKRAAERAKADSIDALCERYISEYARPRKRTWRADQMRLKKDVLPRWRGRAVSSIERRDCLELIDRIAARGAGIVANRTAALISKLFGFAVEKLIIDTNPAARLPKPGVESANRRDKTEADAKPYTPEEIRAIWKATEELAVAPKAIVRLGLLTGQRPTEISDLAWNEIDGSWWTIPGTRTKNRREHRVFLAPTALALIQAVPRLDDEPRVFVNYRGKRQMAAINAAVFADVRRRRNPRHAMRDTVATGLAALGVAVEDIAKILNHTYGPKVTGIYNAYSYDREKRLALAKWERRIAAILKADDDTTTRAKVVGIVRASA